MESGGEGIGNVAPGGVADARATSGTNGMAAGENTERISEGFVGYVDKDSDSAMTADGDYIRGNGSMCQSAQSELEDGHYAKAKQNQSKPKMEFAQRCKLVLSA